MPLTVTEGTQTDVYSVANSGTEIPIIKLDMGAGTTLSGFTGTILRVTDLLRGTVTNLATGTINALAAGTITAGSIDTLNIGRRHADEFATVVSTGTNVMGTIRAAVSGSQIFVTGLIVSAGSATNVEIASGGTSTPIVGTMYFSANGGVAAMPFDPPIRTASGSALVYKQSTAISPLSVTAVGYID